MRLCVSIVLVLLAGCGSIDSIKNSESTDYVTLSYSKAGGMYQWFTGETEACKMTKHGITGLSYDLELDDKGCRISAMK